MQREFKLDQIASVEFCVNVRSGKDIDTNYLVPTDKSVQQALTEVLIATVEAITPEGGSWAPYELSERYSSKESLRAALADEAMASVRALHNEEGWA